MKMPNKRFSKRALDAIVQIMKKHFKRKGNDFAWKKSVRFRLMGVLAIVPLILGIIMFAGIFYVYQNRIVEEYTESAVSTARMIASQISGEDIDRYYETLEEDEEYGRLLNLMRLTARASGAKYIYISKYIEGGEVFLFDADENEDDKFGLGECEDWSGDQYNLEILSRLLRGERVAPYTVSTRWGWLLTVHEPVFRADGSVAGYANVDFSMDLIMRERKIVFTLVGLIVLLAFSASIVFNIYVIQRHVISPIEAHVQSRNAEWEAVMSNYKGIIWSVDMEGTITTFKGRYLDVIGVTPAFLEGKKLELARLKNRHLDILESVEKTFHEGPQDWLCEIGEGVFHSNTVPVFDDGGKVIGVVGSTDDISEMVKLQKDLEAALKMAQAASRAKSEFLANMSHEIRTPMNAIIGMTNIAQSSHSSERKDYALGRIGEASNHLLGVINDILDMSKIEAGKLELHFEPFVFEELIRNVANIINFRVVEKRQKFAVDIDERIPRKLICDDQRLAQVMTNLLSNAVKFTPEDGAISLSATLQRDDDKSCEIKFDVMDTGVGIDEDHQARLFKPFEQAESSTTRKYGGTGLGLAISKRIIELMGGGLSVSSALGKGATFTFTVRCEKPDEEADDDPASAGDAGEESEYADCFSGYRALLTEDMEINREIVMALLEPTQMELDCAVDGAEAVRMFKEEPERYNIIFMDLQMPVMDGFEATRTIRALDDEWAKAIPIIAMTANVFKEDVDNCHAAGMDDHVGKPLDFDAVLQILRRHLYWQKSI